MAKRIRYVVGRKGSWWRLTRGGEVVHELSTQRRAITAGVIACRTRLLAGELSELIIKGRDGRIRDSRTYGRDPRRTPG